MWVILISSSDFWTRTYGLGHTLLLNLRGLGLDGIKCFNELPAACFSDSLLIHMNYIVLNTLVITVISSVTVSVCLSYFALF